MLMILGLFVFNLSTVPFNTKSRDHSYRWVGNDRLGDMPSYQFLGKGEESMSIDGVLYPELSGGMLGLELLKKMAEKGEPYLLMNGTGFVYGYYIVDKISQEESYLLSNGQAQKIGFSISLKRYDKDLINTADLAELISDAVSNVVT